MNGPPSTADSRPLAAVILAGGSSRRFGRDKAAVEIEGTPSLAHVVAAAVAITPDVAVVGGRGRLPAEVVERIPDLAPGEGPVQAVVAAWRHFPERDLLVLACDMPGLTPRLLSRIAQPLPAGIAARVPSIEGRLQPLAALYGVVARPAFEQSWQAGRRAMRRVLAELAIEPLTSEALRAAGIDPATLLDFDTPDELGRFTGPATGES